MNRVCSIYDALGIGYQPMRKVWKGKGATRWQYWLHVARKSEVLKLTKALLPYLVAKKDEATIVEWFYSKACQSKQYHLTDLDAEMLDQLSIIKRNGGEAPEHVKRKMLEVIPS